MQTKKKPRKGVAKAEIVGSGSRALVNQFSDPTKALVFYNGAKQALKNACRIDQVKAIKNKAEAIRKYAKQAKDAVSQVYAAEIRMRAERKAGELLIEMAANGERDPGGRGRIESRPTIRLDDLGISPYESSRWQKLAEPSDEEFEQALGKTRAQHGSTTAGLLRELKRPEQVSRGDESRLKLRLPKRKFDVIVLDPEWRDNAANLSDEIRILIEQSARKDSHVFVWVPNEYIQAAFKMIENCSLRFQHLFGWRKEGAHQGCKEEFAIYARKGNPKFDFSRIVTIFDAPVPKAGKPPMFYKMIAGATKGSRLDAYSKRKFEGFERWSRSQVANL